MLRRECWMIIMSGWYANERTMFSKLSFTFIHHIVKRRRIYTVSGLAGRGSNTKRASSSSSELISQQRKLYYFSNQDIISIRRKGRGLSDGNGGRGGNGIGCGQVLGPMGVSLGICIVTCGIAIFHLFWVTLLKAELRDACVRGTKTCEIITVSLLGNDEWGNESGVQFSAKLGAFLVCGRWIYLTVFDRCAFLFLFYIYTQLLLFVMLMMMNWWWWFHSLGMNMPVQSPWRWNFNFGATAKHNAQTKTAQTDKYVSW